MTAGYDPYTLVREREEKDFLWEQSRPKCACCGEPITDSCAEDIGDNLYCENCTNEAWRVLRRSIRDAMYEKFGKHKDWPIMEQLCEELVEDFDFYIFKCNFEEEID